MASNHLRSLAFLATSSPPAAQYFSLYFTHTLGQSRAPSDTHARTRPHTHSHTQSHTHKNVLFAEATDTFLARFPSVCFLAGTVYFLGHHFQAVTITSCFVDPDARLRSLPR